MTRALCFNCGSTKFGAPIPCPKCNAGSTGDTNLDMTFSDQNMPVEAIAAFGNVIRAIREVCDDDQMRFWTFIRYVSTHHPDILGVNMPPEQQALSDQILAKAELMTNVVRELQRGKQWREQEESEAGPDSAADDASR